ncbi:MAG: hypothetical protein DMG11_11305 [Acidobacteria bacterium]|nr:MAG: hypothetical protein DMG11_11305 [Acidobacteriota bacterium]
MLLKIALEDFLYIFQIGDSKLLIADPPSLDSANMLMPFFSYRKVREKESGRRLTEVQVFIRLQPAASRTTLLRV